MKKYAVVGFPKCGTMSLANWLITNNPGCQVTRPENIYKPYPPPNGKKPVDWTDWECVTITRDPVDRIHSGHQYFTVLQTLSVEQVIKGQWKNSDKYGGVGFEDCINQSDYKHYINEFETNYNVKIKNYRFEDLIKDPTFPHINKSGHSIKWTDEDTVYVKEQLAKRGITY